MSFQGKDNKPCDGELGARGDCTFYTIQPSAITGAVENSVREACMAASQNLAGVVCKSPTALPYPKNDRLTSIDALRGLAACSVVLSHFVEFNDFISNGWLKYVAHFGRYGVDVFFVISGFVIPYALDQQAFNIRRDWLTFLTRRTIRLEPPYLFAAVVSTLYLYGTQQMPWYHGAIREHLWADLVLHPFYLVPWFDGEWSNLVFWSLAIEFQYYLLAIGIAPFLLSSRRWHQRTCLAAVAIMALPVKDDRLVFYWLPLFSFGFIGFLYMRRAMNPLEAIAWQIGFGLLCHGNAGLGTTVAGLVTICTILFANIRTRLLLGLGTISYSLYLVHVPVGQVIINGFSRLRISNVVFPLLTEAVAISASFAAAYVVWRFVEMPSLAASRRYRQRTPVPITEPTDAAPRATLL
jgi:peptidoglycan/LPS O-acetylase OafA/YrhL